MKFEFEPKGTREEINNAIALFVNSKCEVKWGKRKEGKVTRNVLVIDDGKKKQEEEL